MFKAGVAVREITPKRKCLTCGYPIPADRSAEICHDPLLCSAFYFENDGQRALFFCNDIINMTKDRCNELRMLVEKHTGISRKNVAVSCTHTHSGPVTGGDIWANFEQLHELEPENNDRMRDLMLEAAKEAVANAFEAKVGWGVGICGKEHGVGGNRHDPNGLCDPSVSVLAIKDMTDQLRGCMVNYSLHPTVLHAGNYFYSADFPGYIRETLQEENPFLVFGFQMGSAGDQSSRFFRDGQSFDEAKRIGSAIGEVAKETISQMKFVSDAVVKCSSVYITPPLKEFPTHAEAVETLAKAQKIYDDLVASNAPYKQTRAAQSVLEGSIFMEGFTASLEKGDVDEILNRQLPLECHAMRIGNCCITSTPAENFVAVSLELKERSPFEVTMLSATTNGATTGYIPTDEAYDRFCYEAQASTFAKGAAKCLTEGLLEAANNVL